MKVPRSLALGDRGLEASRITVIRFSTNYPEPQCLFPAFHTRDSGHIRRAAAMLLYLCSWRNSGLGVKTEKRNFSVFLIFLFFAFSTDFLKTRKEQ